MARRAIPEAERLAKQRFVGMRIAHAREKAGYGQREMSTLLGYSTSWLQAVEAGRNGVSALDLQRIAKITEYPIEYFLDPDYQPRSFRPRTRFDWELLYPDTPELARVHAELDALYERLVAASQKATSR